MRTYTFLRLALVLEQPAQVPDRMVTPPQLAPKPMAVTTIPLLPAAGLTAEA